MNNKGKTKFELEINLMNVKVFTTLLGILLICIFFFLIIESQRALNLQKQLQECQEKVVSYESKHISNEIKKTTSFWLHTPNKYTLLVFDSGTRVFIDCEDLIEYHEVWDRTDYDLDLAKKIWCEWNEIKNCEVKG